MFKKGMCLALVAIMLFALAGCGGRQASGSDVDFKIGIMTGTVSQGEEEFRAGEDMVKKYGADVIKHVTYPDKFTQEQETTIAQITSLAADPKVKAIIIVQAVPGVSAAIDKVRETRDDILFIGGAPHEDPSLAASRMDILLEVDQLKRGETIIQLAKEMGAENFVHYSFPRHMSMELLAQRRDIMKETAKKLGINFIEVDAPDPLGDAGLTGAQQFILEDVPRQVAALGKKTAFFNTNCGMQEPLIASILKEGAIYPEQCCPSPYHAYPGALGIEIPKDKAGDVSYMLEQISAKVAAAGGTGNFATWKAPANMAILEAAVDYGVAYAKGEVGKFDKKVIADLLEKAAKGPVTVSELEGYSNFLLFTAESEIF